MNFAIEDSSEQSAFRAEVREFLARSMSPSFEQSVDLGAPAEIVLA